MTFEKTIMMRASPRVHNLVGAWANVRHLLHIMLLVVMILIS